jgi:hypothetical protein
VDDDPTDDREFRDCRIVALDPIPQIGGRVKIKILNIYLDIETEIGQTFSYLRYTPHNWSLFMHTAEHVQSPQEASVGFEYQRVIDDICGLKWDRVGREDLISVAWVYYYFSVQFRENLEIARELYPDDALLLQLDHGERDTDNLSPWPGVAAAGERMNHDEFMRRTLTLTSIPESRRRRLEAIGQSYLAELRAKDRMSRATSIASYEDGGLEKVFGAIVTAQNWDGALLEAFKHFLIEHIKFDSDPEQGHGALCRHLTPDDRILPFWTAFKKILVEAAPGLT